MEITKTLGLTITAIDIQKGVADGTGFVYLDAVGADETPDIDREIFDYSTSIPYIKTWSQAAAETTKAAGQAVSYGNIRAQHGSQGAENAAGTIYEPIDFDAKGKSVRTKIKVVDKDACIKVAEGVYRGLSIKGRLVGKKWPDGEYYRYTVDPVEFSLVDKPANPNATISVIKADGTTEVIAPEKSVVSKAAELLRAMSPDEVKELITMADEIEKAAAIEKMKAARKAHDANASHLGGYCDDDDASKCAEKVAENHKTILEAFKDGSRKKEAEKSATTETPEEKAAREKSESDVKKAAAEVADKAASDKTLQALRDEIKTLTESMAKLTTEKAAGRATPVHPGTKVVSKTDDQAGDKGDLIDKANAIKADDPERIDKIYRLQREAEPEVVKL